MKVEFDFRFKVGDEVYFLDVKKVKKGVVQYCSVSQYKEAVSAVYGVKTDANQYSMSMVCVECAYETQEELMDSIAYKE